MPIQFRCPQCKTGLSARGEQAGSTFTCPNGQKRMRVPRSPSSPPVTAAPAAPPSRPADLATPPPDSFDESFLEVVRQAEEPAAPRTKRCPYCAEEILAKAKKCKHCGEILDRALREERLPQRQQNWNPDRPRPAKHMLRILALVFLVIAALFLALALLFLVVALLAALFGFGMVAGIAWDAARILFLVFLVPAAFSILANAGRGRLVV